MLFILTKHTPSAWLSMLIFKVDAPNSCLLPFQLNYRNDYVTNVRGKNTAPATTVDTERARLANFIQSDVRFYYN